MGLELRIGVKSSDIFEQSGDLITKDNPIQGIVMFIGDKKLFNSKIKKYILIVTDGYGREYKFRKDADNQADFELTRYLIPDTKFKPIRSK
ncbi:hypothetical protein ES705_44847 [subsurface metagenome]